MTAAAPLTTLPTALPPLIRKRTDAALARRPHFDQAGALQATRLHIARTAGSGS